MEIVINNLSEMERFAKMIASLVKKNDIITLEGNLGTGKTTFTQYFAKYLGVKSIVNSPTFNIVKCYFDGKFPLYHIDAYRLEDNHFDMGLEEYLYGEGVCVIEWANFIKDIIPSEALKIKIERIDENKRLLHLSGNEEIIKKVEKIWE